MSDQPPSEANDRRRQILEAALRVFSSKGFEKATNKDIAAEAGGISPGLIYWYFKDKQDLFLSLFREHAAIMQLADHPEQVNDLPVREALSLIGSTYIGMFQVPGNLAIIRVLLSELIRFPQLSELIYAAGVNRLLHMVEQYLQLQISLGQLRPHDTAMAARSFMGMFMAHLLAREILHQPSAASIPDEQVVATAVEMFLSGLGGPGEPASKVLPDLAMSPSAPTEAL